MDLRFSFEGNGPIFNQFLRISLDTFERSKVTKTRRAVISSGGFGSPFGDEKTMAHIALSL